MKSQIFEILFKSWARSASDPFGLNVNKGTCVLVNGEGEEFKFHSHSEQARELADFLGLELKADV